jgi:hypothetical protein
MRVLVRWTLILAATVAVLLPAVAEETLLKDQDIVRMLVAGRSNGEIIESIRAHEVRFDLSNEMLSELRIAGVPEIVLEAMRERQASMAPPPTPSPGPLESEEASIHVLLESEPVRKDKPPAVWFPDRIEEDLARALHLGPAPEDRLVKDLAVFLACLTPEHVPDQWRSRSSLGKDFVSMPRHELLVLHAGAVGADPKDVPKEVRASFPRPRKDEPPPGILRLDLPRELVAHVAPKEKHRLLLGIALRIGDGYLLLASAEKADLEPGPEAQIKGRILEGRKKDEPIAVEIAPAR